MGVAKSNAVSVSSYAHRLLRYIRQLLTPSKPPPLPLPPPRKGQGNCSILHPIPDRLRRPGWRDGLSSLRSPRPARPSASPSPRAAARPCGRRGDRALSAFSGSAKAAMMARAISTSPSAGAKTALAAAIWSGWIRVLPSKPRSRPCWHSARKPSASSDVVIDPVEDVEAVGPGGGEGASSARAASARGRARGGRGCPWRDRWCPSRSRSGACRRSRGGAGDLLDVQDRERRLDHRPDGVRFGAPRAAQASGRAVERSGDDTFGTRIASGAACDGGREVGLAPGRVEGR